MVKWKKHASISLLINHQCPKQSVFLQRPVGPPYTIICAIPLTNVRWKKEGARNRIRAWSFAISDLFLDPAASCHTQLPVHLSCSVISQLPVHIGAACDYQHMCDGVYLALVISFSALLLHWCGIAHSLSRIRLFSANWEAFGDKQRMSRLNYILWQNYNNED